MLKRRKVQKRSKFEIARKNDGLNYKQRLSIPFPVPFIVRVGVAGATKNGQAHTFLSARPTKMMVRTVENRPFQIFFEFVEHLLIKMPLKSNSEKKLFGPKNRP